MITSKQHPLIKHIKQLIDKHSHRQKTQETLLEGAHLIDAFYTALKQGQLKNFHSASPRQAIFAEQALTESTEVQKIWQMTQQLNISSHVLHDDIWQHISAISPKFGVSWLVDMPDNLPANMPVAAAYTAQKTPFKGLILDHVQDAGNMGAIIRTAAAAGYQQIWFLGGAHAYAPKVLRAAMGAHYALDLRIYASSDAPQLLAYIQQYNIHILFTEKNAAQNLYQIQLPMRHAWVLGNEGAGIQAMWRSCAHAQGVSIPQQGAVESLNVGHAAALCLYEALRRQYAP